MFWDWIVLCRNAYLDDPLLLFAVPWMYFLVVAAWWLLGARELEKEANLLDEQRCHPDDLCPRCRKVETKT